MTLFRAALIINDDRRNPASDLFMELKNG